MSLLPDLSRQFDRSAQRRLIDGWKDPEVLIVALVTRFRISPDDVEKLKVALGPKAKAESLNPWWKQTRERERKICERFRKLRAERGQKAGA